MFFTSNIMITQNNSSPNPHSQVITSAQRNNLVIRSIQIITLLVQSNSQRQFINIDFIALENKRVPTIQHIRTFRRNVALRKGYLLEPAMSGVAKFATGGGFAVFQHIIAQ